MNMRPEVGTGQIVVRFGYKREIWRRAMTGWWQSVVPPAPLLRRSIFWAVIWFGVGLFSVALGAAGLSPSLVLWCLAGAGLMVGVFGFLQRTRMEQFWNEIGRHWDRAGETEATFGPSGIKVVDAVSHRHLGWSGIDAIRTVRGGTVFRSGISILVVPDSDLPHGLNAEEFRSRLKAWKTS